MCAYGRLKGKAKLAKSAVDFGKKGHQVPRVVYLGRTKSDARKEPS